MVKVFDDWLLDLILWDKATDPFEEEEELEDEALQIVIIEGEEDETTI